MVSTIVAAMAAGLACRQRIRKRAAGARPGRRHGLAAAICRDDLRRRGFLAAWLAGIRRDRADRRPWRLRSLEDPDCSRTTNMLVALVVGLPRPARGASAAG